MSLFLFHECIDCVMVNTLTQKFDQPGNKATAYEYEVNSISIYL